MSLIKCRLEALRKWMNTVNVQACIIPQTDPHLSEYVDEFDKVRTYFSGFTGSAGTLVVTLDAAGLWTDSRYYLQAEQQLCATEIALFKDGQPNVPAYVDWLVDKVGNMPVAVNAYLFSHKVFTEYAKKLTLVHAPQFESIWLERPTLSNKPCCIFNGYGLSAAQKIALLRAEMRNKKVDACFMSALDNIAWLLNVRGNDVAYVPVVRSYLWVDQQRIVWWVDAKKVQDATMVAYLQTLSVVVLPYSEIENGLLANNKQQRVWVDAAQLSERLYQLLSNSYDLHDEVEWCTLQKACKLSAEMIGIQEAMEYDAVAWVRSLKWLEENLKASKQISELDFQQAMLQYKAQTPYYLGESFAPIVAYGKHGAIVHYESTTQTNKLIEPHGFLLVDAGSHYRYGTTDATRAIACGPLTKEQQTVYTLVLKGMIAVATCRFTASTPSNQIDALAREALRQHGFDYGHGTGHGVGLVLNVHEDGARLSPKWVKPLQEGMVLSDEPGCYLAGQFGVRIENMLAVKADEAGGLFFQTLTHIPLQCSAIDKSLLTQNELVWINCYHKKVLAICKPHLTEIEFNWLKTYAYEL
ncbi:MAG: M24 family metallopeptidase [Paludibacteraceae bacterium]|nr:M24 family metallopeptidase [Paludibacteraceae bacterium]